MSILLIILLAGLVLGLLGFLVYKYGTEECKNCTYAHPVDKANTIFCDMWMARNNSKGCCNRFKPAFKKNKQ